VTNLQARARWKWRSRPALGLVALAVALTAFVAAHSAGAATERVTASGVLVVDNAFNNRLLDPHREASNTANLVFRAVYDTLLTFKGDDYTPRPAVATSWKVSDDDRSITFQLRKDVVFADGTPLTAKDVVFSYARLFNLKVTQSFLLRGLKLRATGKYSVVLESDTPNPALIRIVANPSLSIVNRKLVAANGGTAAANAANLDKAEPWFSKNSAGSGPYVLTEFVPQQQITLEVNTRYWGPKPRFKKVIIRNMPAAAQLLNVQRGTREIAIDVPALEVESLLDNKNVQIWRGPGTNIFYLTVNQTPGATVASNAKILEAIRLGLDYDAIVKLGGPGSARLAGMIPNGLLGSLSADKAVKRNVARAQQLVQESGIKDPAFEVSYVAGFSFAGVSLESLAQKVQSSLQEIGLKPSLIGRPLNTHLQLRAQKKLEVNVGLISMTYPDPNAYLAFAPDGNQAAFISFQDATASSLAARAQATIDDAKRAALFTQFQDRLNQVSGLIPTFQPAAVLVASPKLTNVVRNGIWYIDLAAVSEKAG